MMIATPTKGLEFEPKIRAGVSSKQWARIMDLEMCKSEVEVGRWSPRWEYATATGADISPARLGETQ